MNIYIPNENDIIHETSVDFVLRPCAKEIHIVQYDKSLPIIKVELFKNGERYIIPDNTNFINVCFGKIDHKFVYKHVLGTNEERNVVYFEVDEQMATIACHTGPVLEIIYGNKIAHSSPIPFVIDKNPIQNDYIESSDYFPIIYELQVHDIDHENRIQHLEAQVSGEVVTLHTNQYNIDGEKGFLSDIYVDTNGSLSLRFSPTLPQHAVNKGYVDTAIENVEMRSDVIDVVGTYQDLENYDTTDVKLNDLIKVISDETHSNSISYYRWVQEGTTDPEWSFVASEGPFYTITQVDEFIEEINDDIEDVDERKLELHPFNGFVGGSQVEDQVSNGQIMYCQSGTQSHIDPTQSPIINIELTQEHISAVSNRKAVYIKSIKIYYTSDDDPTNLKTWTYIFTERVFGSGSNQDDINPKIVTLTDQITGQQLEWHLIYRPATGKQYYGSYNSTKGQQFGSNTNPADYISLYTTSLQNATVVRVDIEISGNSGTNARGQITLVQDHWKYHDSDSESDLEYATATSTSAIYDFFYPSYNDQSGTHLGTGGGAVIQYEHIFLKKENNEVTTVQANSDYLYIEENGTSDSYRLYKFVNNQMEEVSKTRLGSTADTAYRGDWGDDNYRKITQVLSGNNTEFNGTKIFNDLVTLNGGLSDGTRDISAEEIINKANIIRISTSLLKSLKDKNSIWNSLEGHPEDTIYVYSRKEMLTLDNFNEIFNDLDENILGYIDVSHNKFEYTDNSQINGSKITSWIIVREINGNNYGSVRGILLTGEDLANYFAGNTLFIGENSDELIRELFANYSTLTFEHALSQYQVNTYKVSSFQATPDDLHYPSEKLVYDQLALKENISNKVTSLSGSNTDTQYPSAKCVYDALYLKADKTGPLPYYSVTSETLISSIVAYNGSMNGTPFIIKFEASSNSREYLCVTQYAGYERVILIALHSLERWDHIYNSTDYATATFSDLIATASNSYQQRKDSLPRYDFELSQNVRNAVKYNNLRNSPGIIKFNNTDSYLSYFIDDGIYMTGYLIKLNSNIFTVYTVPQITMNPGISDTTTFEDVLVSANASVGELQSNKVTSLSAESTDIQYPSAKLVYDQLTLKADKVGPVPMLPQAEWNDVVKTYFDNNNAWSKVVLFFCQGSLYFGKVSSPITNYIQFELENVGGRSRFYSGGVTIDETSFTFSQMLSSTYSRMYEEINDKVSSFQATPDDLHYPSEKLVYDQLALKVNKLTTSGTFVYSHNGSTQGEIQYGIAATASSLVQRDSTGAIEVPLIPLYGSQAASKKYIDDATVNNIISEQDALDILNGNS